MCDATDTLLVLVTRQARVLHLTAPQQLQLNRKRHKASVNNISGLIHVDADVVKGLFLSWVYGRDC